MTRPESPRSHPPEAEALRRALDKARLLSVSIDVAEALRQVSDALRLARRLGDKAAQAQACAIAAVCHYYRGDYVAAVAAGLDACGFGSDGGPEIRAQATLSIAYSFLSVGDLRRAEQAASRATLLAAQARDARGEAQARAFLGCVLGDADRYGEAIATLRQARAAFRRQDDAERVSATAVNIGHVLNRQARKLDQRGDHPGAMQCWRNARRYYLQALESGRPRLGAAMAQASLADCEMRLGNLAEARAMLQRARGILRPQDAPRIAARVTWLAGEVERRMGHAEAAAKLLGAALGGADTIEADELAAQCRESLAALAAHRGDRTQAKRWAMAARLERERRLGAQALFRREMRPMWDRHLRLDPD